jgi:hypothetical protein
VPISPIRSLVGSGITEMNIQPNPSIPTASVDPITPKLNFDVLSTIFGLADISPWTLVHIDRLWRTTAFSIPPLWASIRVTGLKAFDSRYVDGKEICNTPTRLETALKRAGNTPLYLELDLFIDGLNEASQNMLRTMIPIIIRRKQLWRYVKCQAGCYPWKESGLFSGPFPMLWAIEWRGVPLLNAFEPSQGYEHCPPWNLLALVLRYSPAIERAVFRGLATSRIESFDGFVNLSRLELHQGSFTVHVHFPNLTEMRLVNLTCNWGPGNQSDRPVTAPQLTSFVMDGCDATVLNRIKMPSLRHLTICGRTNGSGGVARERGLSAVVERTWTGGHHGSLAAPSLRSLRLRYQDISTEDALRFLRTSPELDYFELVYPKSVGPGLFQTMASEHLCPTLAELHLEFHPTYVPGGLPIDEGAIWSIYRFLSGRTKSGIRRVMYRFHSHSEPAPPMRDIFLDDPVHDPSIWPPGREM